MRTKKRKTIGGRSTQTIAQKEKLEHDQAGITGAMLHTCLITEVIAITST